MWDSREVLRPELMPTLRTFVKVTFSFHSLSGCRDRKQRPGPSQMSTLAGTPGSIYQHCRRKLRVLLQPSATAGKLLLGRPSRGHERWLRPGSGTQADRGSPPPSTPSSECARSFLPCSHELSQGCSLEMEMWC